MYNTKKSVLYIIHHPKNMYRSFWCIIQKKMYYTLYITKKICICLFGVLYKKNVLEFFYFFLEKILLKREKQKSFESIFSRNQLNFVSSLQKHHWLRCSVHENCVNNDFQNNV